VSLLSIEQNNSLLRSFMLGCLLVFGTHAHGSGLMECDSGDPTTWQSQDELEKSLVAAGWQVRKTEVDEGCYEVYGTTPEGDRVEAYFDPVTLQKLLVARRGVVLFRKESASAE